MPGIGDLCAAWTINGKAVTLDAMAQQSLLARDPKNTESRLLSQELREVYNAQANLTYGWAPGKGERTNQLLNRLSERERELVRQIGQSSRRSDQIGGGSWVELAAVRKALPRDSALIELIRLEPSRAGKTPKGLPDRRASYAALIVLGGPDSPVRMIDLGSADVIEAAVTGVRKAIPPDAGRKLFYSLGEREAERRVLVPLRKLAELILDPLYPHLAGAQRWYLSPDAALWLVPWVALPLKDGPYVIERHEIHYVVSGRDLVRPREPVPSGRSLVMADPDYSFLPANKPEEPRRSSTAGRRRRRTANRSGADVPAPAVAAKAPTARASAAPRSLRPDLRKWPPGPG